MNGESLDRESNRKPSDKVSTFEDLEVYRVAREFRKKMYYVARRMPDIEKFALANQIRRAAVSLTNNIAEGHGRYHYLDQIRFTLHSRGSLQELIDDLNVCEDEQYLPVEEIVALKSDGWRTRQLIDGYLRYLRRQNSLTRGASIREESPESNEDTTIHDSRFDDSQFSIDDSQ